MYNTPTHHSNGQAERVSIAMPTIEPEPTFFRSYGVHAIISTLMFGFAALVAVSSYNAYPYSIWSTLGSFPFLFLVVLAAAVGIIPVFLFWRQRARQRLFDAMPVESSKPDRDSFFY